MLHIFRTEWLKVKSYRTFWVLIGLTFVSFFGVNFGAAEITGEMVKQSKGFITSVYDFPTVWQMMAIFGNYAIIFPGFLVIILVTNEFTFKTHRQNIIDGWSRRDFIISKLFWVVALSVFSLVCAVVFGLILGLIYGQNSISFEDFSYMWYFFGQTLLVLSLGLLLGVLIKRAGFTIVIFMAYVMGGEQILVLLGKRYDISLVTLLPMQATDELIPFPTILGKMARNVSLYGTSVYILSTLAFIALLTYFTSRKLSRADL
jgi:ABC-2 type transport system permease protein